MKKSKLLLLLICLNIVLLVVSLFGKMEAQDKEGWRRWNDDSHASYTCLCEGIGCKPCWGESPSLMDKIDEWIMNWFYK